MDQLVRILPFLAAALLLAAFGMRFAQLWRRNKARERAFAALAAEHGWTYVAQDLGLVGQMGLQPTASHWQTNFIRGQVEGSPFVLYEDVTFKAKEGRRTRTCAAFQAGRDLPQFRAFPRSFLPSIDRTAPPMPRARFPEDRRFDSLYWVEGTDPKAALAALPQTVREVLAASSGWAIESRNGWLRLWDGKFDPPVAHAPGMLERARRIAVKFN